ncbi:HIT family protein [Shinella sp. 838]|jgi:diadenosine tetraphosphate (Ap4A) HIT family hydrolase|uniref:HIT domain-containing protein n=1 Tax=unclassified Shinella TaxID=2643062 RepID=UPI000437A8BA|nr:MULTISPECIES: HIT family protein [unclassified Shinella]EYR84162.1 diadenosine tetraphosphate hydrolase [Shinella sp. DD12]MCA0340256.1 HIT family protein [Pseudomonadota bacterium]MDG4672163.1 HIT family protein [Shinella sp. 838]
MPWHDSRKQACRENPLSDFQLDERIVRDSDLLTKIGLCELRLMKDSRWPWLMLVPQRPGASEIFDLTPLDQTMLTFETTLVAEALKTVTGATKINVAALGNIVRQLHVHVIARSEGDANWPGPVWGFGTAEPRTADETKAFSAKILDALTP